MVLKYIQLQKKIMGLGSRIFIVNDDGSLHRLSMAKFERLFQQDLKERMVRYAGRRVKYAHVVVELENRKPVKVVMSQFSYLPFDTEGRIDQASMEKEARLGMEIVEPIDSGPLPENVVDARHHFARKRFSDRYLWQPDPDIIEAIIEAIFGKKE